VFVVQVVVVYEVNDGRDVIEAGFWEEGVVVVDVAFGFLRV
jgi:hypothetical protein